MRKITIITLNNILIIKSTYQHKNQHIYNETLSQALVLRVNYRDMVTDSERAGDYPVFFFSVD